MSKIKINKHSAWFVYAEEVVVAKELGGYRDYKLILKARYPDGSKRSVKYPKGYNTYFDSRTPKKRAIIKCVKQEMIDNLSWEKNYIIIALNVICLKTLGRWANYEK